MCVNFLCHYVVWYCVRISWPLLCGAVACRVHVPLVHEDMTSPRVLVMEFIDGVQVTDKEGLRV
jgi:hypothetical protein